MDITDTLYVSDREEWRKWLEENYKTATEIWLIYYRKHTGVPRVPYNDAVEEALCFGWIDSTAKKIDQDRYAQRFTPRNSRSTYSQTNKERLRRLIEKGKVVPDVLATVRDVAASRMVDDVVEVSAHHQADAQQDQRNDQITSGVLHGFLLTVQRPMKSGVHLIPSQDGIVSERLRTEGSGLRT